MNLKNSIRLFSNCVMRDDGVASPFKLSTLGYNNPADLSIYGSVYDFMGVSFFDFNTQVPHVVAVVYNGTNFLLSKFRIDEADTPDTITISAGGNDPGFIDYEYFLENYYFSANQINVYYTNTDDVWTALTTPPTLASGEEISCISSYGGRLVCGGNHGNIYFSKVGTDNFAITGTVTDGLKFSIDGIPKCIKNINDTLVILCTDGTMFYLKGDLLSANDTVLKKITKISFGEFFPTTRSMINKNSKLFVFTENGIMELYRDIYTDSFKLDIKNDMFEKHWLYIYRNWDLSTNYFLRFPMLSIYNDNMIDIFSSYIEGRNESIIYDVQKDTYKLFNNELITATATDFEYATISENLKYVDYGSSLTRYFNLSDFFYSEEYSYIYFKPSLYPQSKTYNALAKISYIPTTAGSQDLEINLYFNEKLLGTISETTSAFTLFRDNIKTKRLNIGKFDGSGQYIIKFKKCSIVNFDLT